MKKVLIVDDSEFIRNTLFRIMKDHELSVVGMASNGLEAIDRFRSLNPDIVTLDISMPVMDGLKALKRLRELSHSVVIIVISSVSAEANLQELQEAGANFFIAKPFDERDVLYVLKQFD